MKYSLIKLAVASAIVGPALLATSAFASVTQTNMLVNGDVHGSAASGDVVNLSVQFTNTGVSTYQSAWVEIPGSGFPGECVDILDENQIGTHTVNVNVNTLGTTEGQWPVSIRPFGINRVTTGSQPTDTDCTNPQGAAKLFGNQLKITNPISVGDTANNTGNGGVNGNGNGTGGTGVNNGNNGSNGTGSTGNTSSTTPPAWFTQWLASHNLGGSDSSLCSLFKSDLSRAVQGTRTTWNAVLQGFLIGAGESIPALDDPRVPFGFFGPQTLAATIHFQNVHGCQ